MKEWRQKVFANRPGYLFTKPIDRVFTGKEFESILLLNSWRPHRDETFRREMKEYNGVKVVIICGGMTPLL